MPLVCRRLLLFVYKIKQKEINIFCSTNKKVINMFYRFGSINHIFEWSKCTNWLGSITCLCGSTTINIVDYLYWFNGNDGLSDTVIRQKIRILITMEWCLTTIDKKIKTD